MQVNVTEECIGCELCVGICEDVFEMGDDGLAHVKAGADLESNGDAIRDAAEQCPVDAIEVS
jgi:ferredoxin